ncbi:MAG: PilZ domain-containing protein [Alphaproteobacteria bacterium]|nr:PilZ domain-containing protein [Alphaproteobacteria bacterium]
MTSLSIDSTAGRDEIAEADQRAAKRYTSLIRAAKLVSAHGEFVCVIRDVSSTGISLRMFHDVPGDEVMDLELQNGDRYELSKVRCNAREASFTFADEVEVEGLIRETWKYPKRQLRLNLVIPLSVTTLAGTFRAVTSNLSQQGASIECDARFALDQTVRIEGKHMPEVRAKVRWRKDNCYGVVFDNTFTLREFGVLAAQFQCPTLVRSDEV